MSRAYWFLMLGAWGCSVITSPGDFTIERDGGTADAAELPDGSTDGSVDGGAACVTAEDCPSRPFADVACRAGSCVIDGCEAGHDDCDGDFANGCEANLLGDVENCGTCGNACAFPNAVPACVAESCVIEACLGGFEDCNADRSDGCEADLRSPESCGACGAACPADTPLCDSTSDPAQCVESCDADATLCGTRCVATATDPMNCGGCGVVCDPAENAAAVCVDSACDLACFPDFGDCDDDPTNGCEANITTSTEHCGGCGNRCEGAQATWSCEGGACNVAACDPGFDDCDGDSRNGCEADLLSDAGHCGGCGVVCDGPCVDGLCDPITDIAATGGSQHTCVLRTSRRVLCWGHNDVGQVGDGTFGTKAIPTPVAAPMGSTEPLLAAAVAAGQASTCAIDTVGQLWCWGSGLFGERGSGDAAAGRPVNRPEAVTSSDADFASRTFEEIAAGSQHYCARDGSGDVWCWGANTDGQVGVIGDTTVTEATRVAGVSGALQLGLLAQSSCALVTGGEVWCWGKNSAGQLGDGTTSGGATPRTVQTASGTLTGVTALAAGSGHACALADTGLYCWGVNSSRETDDSGANRTSATAVDPGVGAIDEVHAGSGVTCVHRAAGGYSCWGRRTEGQRGDGMRSPNDATPTEPTGTGSARRLLLRGTAGYAFMPDGSILSWGNNGHGALAQEPVAVRSTPTTVVNTLGSGSLSPVSELAVGHRHGCAIAGGDVYCWGEALYNGTTGGGKDTAIPTPFAEPMAQTVYAGTYATAIGRTDDSAVAWGLNSNGAAGVGNALVATPTGAGNPQAVAVPPVLDLAYSSTHGCGVVSGTVYCWGANSAGQLGRGSTSTREVTPAPVTGLASDVVEVAVGEGFSCARRANGEVWCWGRNLGMGGNSATPAQISSLSNAIAVDAGEATACAVVEAAIGDGSGEVYCWGQGPLGDGTSSSSATPVRVRSDDTGMPVTDAVDVTVGAAHGCIIRSSGEVWCWGENESAEVGDGTTAPRLRATRISGVTGALEVEAAGLRGRHTCAMQGDATVVCWGDCRQGACGTGEEIYRATPAVATSL